MAIFDELIESRIREAANRGDFDDLPGKGRPLPEEEGAFVPDEMRMAYKILKNAGYIPPEVELRRDIAATEAAVINAEENDPQRRRNLKKLQTLFLRLDESRRRQASMLVGETYYEKIIGKL